MADGRFDPWFERFGVDGPIDENHTWPTWYDEHWWHVSSVNWKYANYPWEECYCKEENVSCKEGFRNWCCDKYWNCIGGWWDQGMANMTNCTWNEELDYRKDYCCPLELPESAMPTGLPTLLDHIESMEAKGLSSWRNKPPAVTFPPTTPEPSVEDMLAALDDLKLVAKPVARAPTLSGLLLPMLFVFCVVAFRGMMCCRRHRVMIPPCLG
eukprot:gnl/TRDRNA2_/TRDRNA2_160774_c0_seq1.p1 gnl/TRDRNA2_/TRDRNA2_160774_c0~~gnl/TRDRNA2_/TRDRNA2_160774_c0_seq1.p1  ORF type:complete len:211 (+),score=24.77 gnl/TRDRNA2_/TRDRNA2_160774_c0_seq1:108-740(+)